MKLQEEALVALRKNAGNEPVFKLTKGGKVLELRTPDLRANDGGVLLLPELVPGKDYKICLSPDGDLMVSVYGDEDSAVGTRLGGFHVDLDGKSLANSIWDLSFRPVCPDPRGMVLVQDSEQMFWVDIYLMGRDGKSRAGVEIADGWKKLPMGFEKFRQVDAIKLAANHGKQLLSIEEFALAADGVEEGKAMERKPIKAERIEGLTSRFGLEQATGSLWIWGRDLYRDYYPRVLGGSWFYSGSAGPRHVYSGSPGSSYGSVGARGRCDHMKPVRG